MAKDNLKSVLIIDNSHRLTGAFKSILSFTEVLKERINFTFIIPHGATTANVLNEKKVVHHHLKLIEVSRKFSICWYIPQLIINTYKALKLVQSKRIQVIHVNDIYNMLGIMVKLLYPNILLIYHVRLLPTSYLSSIFEYLAKIVTWKADFVICVSKVVFDALPASSKKLVIYDSFNFIEEYPPFLTRHSSPIKLLYLANYIPGKGHQYALKAFKMAMKHTNHIKLKFVGSDMGLARNRKYQEALKAYAQVNHLMDYVSFESFQPDAEREFKDADILLNFSESESFSMTCLEALYYGIPIIATECGGPSEIIKNNVTGKLVSNKNEQEMAQAIVELATSFELREKYNLNSRKQLGNKFNITILASRLEKIYQSSPGTSILSTVG